MDEQTARKKAEEIVRASWCKVFDTGRGERQPNELSEKELHRRIASALVDAARVGEGKVTEAAKVLEELQHSKHVRGYGEVCPICEILEENGHAVNCRLAAILRAVQNHRPASSTGEDEGKGCQHEHDCSVPVMDSNPPTYSCKHCGKPFMEDETDNG